MDPDSRSADRTPSTALRVALWGWVALALAAWLWQFRPLIEAVFASPGR